jgi:transcriptional regulator GlxA family with amidase domain
MKRRDLLCAAAAGVAASGLAVAGFPAISAASTSLPRLTPPKRGPVVVAVVVGEGAVVMDFVGPWEAFSGATYAGTMNGMQPRGMPWPKNPGFQLAMVSDHVKPFDAEGVVITPQYSFDNYPGQPNVIVIGAQDGPSPAKLAWIRAASKKADLVMSVCTGAFILAKTGLLDGLKATTHHDGYDAFAEQFPRVQLQRGPRFVDNGKIATSGGVSSGVDLALNVINRYYGDNVADTVAYWMEYNRSTRRPVA